MTAAATVLIVDDDPNILAGLRRHLGSRYRVTCAQSGDEALRLVAEDGQVAVVLCDMRMPGMSGLELLQALARLAPDTVRMMLTGNGDQRTAAEAINQGNVFRFFTKPCPLAALTEGIDAGVRQHQLVTAERELLNGTLTGSVRMLTEVLALIAPDTFLRAQRLRRWAVEVAAELKLAEPWIVETAALLSCIGMVAVPPETVARRQSGHALSDGERAMLDKVPEVGAGLIANVPRLEPVARAVELQRGGTDLPVEAQVLQALLAVDDAGDGRVTPTALAALEPLRARLDHRVLMAVGVALHRTDGAGEQATRTRLDTTIGGLLPGDLLDSDLCLASGRLVLAAGEQITSAVFVRLKNLAKMFPFREPVRVRRPMNSERPYRWQ